MYTRDSDSNLITLTFRLTSAAKSEIQRRAAEQTKAQGKEITPGQIVRELVEFALKATKDQPPDRESALFDEVMAAALFARRAFQLWLSDQGDLADKMLNASRAEVRRGRTRT